MSKIYFSVINDLSSDQRVNRIILSLVNRGVSVCLVGRKLPDSLPLEKRSYATHRMRLMFRKGFLFYAFFNIRLFLFLIYRRKIDFLVANDLDTLPANFFVSRLRKIPLIYDSHEYFTEVPELIDRQKVRNFWLNVEKRLLPKIKHAYTVSEPIAEVYKQKYNVDFKVIHNYPLRNRLSDDYILPFNKDENKILIYQGALNIGRGLEILIDVVAGIQDVILILVGDGDIRKSLEKKVFDNKLDEKIYFLGKIPFEKMPGITRQADAGISIEEDLGLNYRYAMPNKLFDYIQSGIPVLVSDLPEMKRVVERYNIGIILENREIDSIRKAINTLLFDESKRLEWKTGLEKAANDLCWEQEENKLLEIYFQAGLSLS